MTDRERESLLKERVFNDTLDNSGGVKPTYAGTYEDQIKDIYSRIQNREPFKYDVNADPLYDMYKDKYIQGGKLAMKDTMGQAAALTGGYGNTYGQQVGQQAYDAYLQNLADVIPELYDRAYGKYKDEGDDLVKLYGLAGDLRDQEYGRYRDELSDWNYNEEVQRELEDLLYNRRVNEEQTAWSRKNTEDQQAWERQQKNYNNLLQLISTTGYQPSDAELAAAGMSRAQADAAWAQALREWSLRVDGASGGGSSGGGRSGGGGGGGGGSGGYRSGSDVAEMQRQLNAMGAGLDVDGVWGPKTQAAYEQYMGGSAGGPVTQVGVDGYTGQPIYGNNYTEAAQAYIEDDLAQYVTVNKPTQKSKGNGGR